MKLNFNFNLKGLDGKEIGVEEKNPVNAGKLIATALVQVSKGDVMKHYEWAQKLYKGQPLELDKSDSAYLKNFIETNEQFTILMKAQCIEVFDKAKP